MSLSCNKAGFLVFRLKWWQFQSRLSDFNLTPSLAEMILTQNSVTISKCGWHFMLYERNYPNSCPLFLKRSFKKVNFRIGFAPFYNSPSLLLRLLIFGTKCFDKNFYTRFMNHWGYFFINFLLINRSRLLALSDCICDS